MARLRSARSHIRRSSLLTCAEEDLDLTYRNEAALTVSLMGLLAEESLIGQRLGKLGRKKTAA